MWPHDDDHSASPWRASKVSLCNAKAQIFVLSRNHQVFVGKSVGKLLVYWRVIPSCCFGVFCFIFAFATYELSYELQPKFSVMESSIGAIFIFWKLSWGLENSISNTLFKKTITFAIFPKPEKNDKIHSSTIDDLELYTKYWPWPTWIWWKKKTYMMFDGAGCRGCLISESSPDTWQRRWMLDGCGWGKTHGKPMENPWKTHGLSIF